MSPTGSPDARSTTLQILVVEDDPGMRETCVEILSGEGYRASGVDAADEALSRVGSDGHLPDIVLTDVRMPGLDGLELLDEIKDRCPGVDVVVMTAFGSVKRAVDAMRRGAADYVTKPFDRDELLLAIRRVVRVRGLRTQVDELREGVEERYRFDSLVAQSPAMRPVLRRMVAASRSQATVLLGGESGTGKDVVARSIHFAGSRAAGPFVPVNCAGLPSELIESELFGHTRGAFSGAVAASKGLIRRAHGGTLLLDEITEMPLGVQAKLLRFLQDKSVRPVGGAEEQAVDVRIVAATNRVVEQALEEGRLREDLYFRLAVLRIDIPPLRERPEDLLPLLRHFVDAGNRDRPRQQGIHRIDPEVDAVLRRHDWVGNVRELENVVERCFALGVTGTLTAAEVARELHPSRPGQDSRSAAQPSSPAPEGTLEEIESRAVAAALDRTGGNKAAAARALGISRKTLYRKIDRLGL